MSKQGDFELENQTTETAAAVATSLFKAKIMSENDDDKFNWSVKNEDVIVPDQRATAVYSNPWGQVVIRQYEQEYGEADPFVVIDRAHIRTLIDALDREFKLNAQREYDSK